MAALDQIPGLAGYVAAQQGAQQQTMGTLNMANVLEQLQQRAAANQKEQAYRAALSAARTPEEQEKVAIQFGGPDAVMKSLDRRAQLGATRDAQQAALQQKADQAAAALEQKTKYAEMMHEFRLAQAKSADERAAEVARHNKVVESFQAQNAAINADLKRLGLQMAGDKADAAKQQGVQKQTQMLGTALERANLPEADAVLRSVEDALKKRPDLAEFLSGPKSLLPDAVVDKEIASGRQAFAKLFNITLKNRSGAAVTNQELDRLKNEFATGVMKTPDQLRKGVEQARNIIGQHYRSVASGFGPEALNAYNGNMRELGGTPLLEPQAAPNAGPKADPLGIR